MTEDEIHDRESRRGPRVLIVEPRRQELAGLARRLADSGYRLALADSAQTAVAEIYRASVDIVVALLKGPGFCGGELVSFIRGDTVLRDLPVMLVGAKGQHDEAVHALKLGADAIFRQPFHLETICARIEREIERKRLIDELRQSNRTLDARVTERAITIGEIRLELAAREAECARLAALLGPTRAAA
jgi:DNA-binding response OmpR family regulator